MTKILTAAVLGAALAAGATAADAQPGHGHGQGPAAHSTKGHAKKCAKPRRVGFVVRGTFVSGDGASVTLTVTKANRHARRSGLVTVGDAYTATPADPARIRYVNRSGPGDAQPTDRVKVVGKVTALKHGCSDEGFSPTLTVRRVVVVGPDTVEAPEPD